MRRPKRRARRFIGWIVLAAAVGAMLWWAGRTVCGAGGRAGLCGWDRIARIEVRGALRLDADQVRAWAAVPLGTPLSALEGSALVARLEGRPWVRTVTVTKQFPHTVIIEVTERMPVAVATTDRGRVLLDTDGTVIGPTTLSRGFPMIIGASTSRPERMQLAARILAGFRTADVSLAPIDALVVDVSNPDDPLVELPGALRVRLGREEFVEKWRRFEAIAGNAADRMPSPRVMDLRFPDRAVVSTWDRAL